MWTVLVADDEYLIRWAMSQGLRNQFLVFTAEDADEALDILKRAHVDALVTDLNMPGRDGIELAEIVRRLYPHVLVFALTAYGDDTVYRHLIDIGVRACLDKPFDIDHVIAILQTHLDAAHPTAATP